MSLILNGAPRIVVLCLFSPFFWLYLYVYMYIYIDMHMCIGLHILPWCPGRSYKGLKGLIFVFPIYKAIGKVL